ncbi:hypothetical protein D0T84_15625 [Dysgonomonas sp. 521]|uniref:acyltransferase family protein n=1 Tax=Dysgonomonas sp. 521 TaxID=2302932 RepID=UPI0013D18ECE|nr:acyltransferase family protein [Dysgonomonas sp. 521]NDV96332.1 hypothetical protein [Dysgonomonas sp. 521]
MTIENKEKVRLHWIDYAKLIGVWLVAINHVNMDSPALIDWILSFHMPLFFMLSGFVDKGKASVSDTIKKSAKSLLIPYFWFYIISYVWWLVVTFRRHPELYSHDFMGGFVKPMIGMLLGEGYHSAISTMINVPLWFLVGLFFCRVIFYLFLSFSREKYYGLILVNILSLIVIFLRNHLQINIFWSIDSAIMAIPFYTFGFFMKRFLDKMDPNVIYKVVLSVSLLIIGILLSRWNGFVDINTSNYGKNLFVYYINGLIGALAVIFFTRIFTNFKSPLLIYLGKNTLILFAFHLIITGWVKKAYELITGANFGGNYIFTPWESAAMCAVVMLISVIPIYIINKYFPFMLGKSKKVLQPDVK